jgi:hypothetical protein
MGVDLMDTHACSIEEYSPSKLVSFIRIVVFLQVKNKPEDRCTRTWLCVYSRSDCMDANISNSIGRSLEYAGP